MAKNIYSEDLVACSEFPLTGFFRNGKCDTCAEDTGMHSICVQMTEDFLAFSKQRGNDLSTPQPAFHFPGLRPGDFWCLCLARWVEAYNAGMAPRVKLESTHASVIEFIDLEILESFAVKV